MAKVITCEQFRDNVDCFIQGMLDFIQEARIVQHGQTCKECGGDTFKEKIEEAKRVSAGWTNQKCRDCLSDFTVEDYVKGDLSPEEEEMIRVHIDVCAECESMVTSYAEYRETLS